jgi:tripartite-type tricarboxylate transporter receptor subunit TctC
MLLVPGKTPASVINKINAETLRALKDKDMIDLLTRGGADPLGNSPREAMDFLKVEIARWGKAVKQAGVKVD